MSDIDDLLKSIHLDATPQELAPVAHLLGNLVVRGDDATLARFYDQMRRTLRVAYRETLHGFLYGQVQLLESYFASRETILQLERLAEEVKRNPLWLEILRALDGHDWVEVESLRARVTEAFPEDTQSKEVFGFTLEDLALREVIERFPGEHDVPVCALKRRGSKLLLIITPQDAAANGTKTPTSSET